MILWFSGTGNSRRAARIISQALAEECVSMNDYIQREAPGDFSSQRPFVFVTPTHGWRMPRAVESFIRGSVFSGDRRAYFVMTCGDDIGAAGEHNRRLCAERGLEYMGTRALVMPENYLAMFPVPEQDEAMRIVAMAEKKALRIAEEIGSGVRLPDTAPTAVDRAKSSLVNTLFYTFSVTDRGFHVTDECLSCGNCAEGCPVNDIDLRDGRPVWLGRCIHCMSCIARCPAEAIEFRGVSRGKNRYYLDD